MISTRYVPVPLSTLLSKKKKHHLYFIQKFGIAIFVLYFSQPSLGAIIHWIGPQNARGRPLQNYPHAVIGLLLITLAFYRVRMGY